MKTNTIILFFILQSFVSAVSSQNIKDGFKIYTKKNTTWFSDVNAEKYRTRPRNIKGEDAINPSARFSTLEKLKKFEKEIYSLEEMNNLYVNYFPMALFSVNAKDGKILTVTFTFDDLPDISLIDTKKLAKLREKLISEIMYEGLLFNGQKAASGHMIQGVRLFKH